MSPVEVGKRAGKEFLDDDMTTYAAALAYHGLFALFPFLIFLLALLGFLNIPGFFTWLLEQSQAALPQDADTRVQQVVGQIQNQRSGGLLSFGIVVAVWGASSGVRALMNGLNAAYDAAETRPTWRRYLLSVLYTLGLAILIIVSVGLMVLGPRVIEWIAEHIGLGSAFVTLWTWARLPVAVILLMLTGAIIYYLLPNVEQPFRLITPGAVLAVIVWLIASLIFSFYVSNFGNYSATYGSLASVIILLFYFFISAAVLLLGAEINAQVHHAEEGEPTPKENGASAT